MLRANQVAQPLPLKAGLRKDSGGESREREPKFFRRIAGRRRPGAAARWAAGARPARAGRSRTAMGRTEPADERACRSVSRPVRRWPTVSQRESRWRSAILRWLWAGRSLAALLRCPGRHAKHRALLRWFWPDEVSRPRVCSVFSGRTRLASSLVSAVCGCGTSESQAKVRAALAKPWRQRVQRPESCRVQRRARAEPCRRRERRSPTRRRGSIRNAAVGVGSVRPGLRT